MVAPGASVRLDAVEDRRAASGIREAHVVQRDGGARRIGGSEHRLAHLDAGGQVQHLEDPLGAGQPVGAGVVLRAELAQRRVELGSEDQHGQPRLERERPGGELDADGDRDERRAERRQQLEHERREEADAQRRHRLAAVALARVVDRLRGRVLAAERAQGLEAGDDIEEARAESRQRPPAPARALLGGHADEDHEDAGSAAP